MNMKEDKNIRTYWWHYYLTEIMLKKGSTPLKFEKEYFTLAVRF